MGRRRETDSGLRGEFFSATRDMANREADGSTNYLWDVEQMCDCEWQNVEDWISREEGLTHGQEIFQIHRE